MVLPACHLYWLFQTAYAALSHYDRNWKVMEKYPRVGKQCEAKRRDKHKVIVDLLLLIYCVHVLIKNCERCIKNCAMNAGAPFWANAWRQCFRLPPRRALGDPKPPTTLCQFFSVGFGRWQHYIRPKFALYGNGTESFNPILDPEFQMLTQITTNI